MRFLLQYFAVTVCLIALAWAFVSVQVGERTLYGHMIRTDIGGSLAARWNAWDPATPSVKLGPGQKAKQAKPADEDSEAPAKLARATEPRRKGEPTVQTEKGAIRRVNRLGEAAAKLRN